MAQIENLTEKEISAKNKKKFDWKSKNWLKILPKNCFWPQVKNWLKI